MVDCTPVKSYLDRLSSSIGARDGRKRGKEESNVSASCAPEEAGDARGTEMALTHPAAYSSSRRPQQGASTDLREVGHYRKTVE